MGRDPVLQNLEFSVHSRCRIAVTGQNGAGKSTLLKLITRELAPTSGEVWRHHNLKVASFSQHEPNLLLQYEASPLLYIRTALPELKDQDMAFRPLRSLSGGQCVRTAL